MGIKGHSIRAALASFLLATGTVSLGSVAEAAPFIMGNQYLETVGSTVTICPQSATTCNVPFTAIPVGKRLNVTHVSCNVNFSGTGIASLAIRTNFFTTGVYLSPDLIGINPNGTRSYQSADPVTLPVAAGAFQRPVAGIQVVSTAAKPAITLICTITGTLVAAP